MKNFSKVLLMTVFGSLIYSSYAKADWDYWAVNNLTVSTCVSSTGECTERSTLTPNAGNYFYGQYDYHYVDNENNIILYTSDGNVNSYNLESNKWTTISSDQWRRNYQSIQKRRNVKKGSDGTFSIGENSLKLKETSSSQEMWATNSSGSIAPINITNGTKLLINGRDVEQSIDNVGALSAALTALPTVPTDSPIACGIGTGTHSGNYAFSGGCASKVNEKLSFNAAASFVPGQDYQGTDNSYSARAGFVFKLGKISKKELISKKEKQLDQKVTNLQTENKELKSLVAKQNARLEKLEEIALALKLRKDLEIISMAE